MTDRTLAPPPRRFDARLAVRRNGALLALASLLAFNVALTPYFVSPQTFSINLTQVAPIAIVAVAMTLVIATGGIDLSVGSLMAIAGALAPIVYAAALARLSSVAPSVALCIALPVAVSTALGWLNGAVITRYRIQPIVATLVLYIAGRGIAQVMTNGNVQSFAQAQFGFLGLGRVFGVPFQAVLMVVAVAAGATALRRSLIGRQILAIGGNERAARLSGVPVVRVKRLVYAVSGFASGIAGLITVAINSSSDANLVGSGMELDAIAAVAVGGTLLAGGRATVVGTLVGALVIQFVRTTLIANGVPDAAALVVKAALILGAVWIQRQGRP